MYTAGVATLTQVLCEAIQLYASVAVWIGVPIVIVTVIAVHRGMKRAVALTAVVLGVRFGATTTYLPGSG